MASSKRGDDAKVALLSEEDAAYGRSGAPYSVNGSSDGKALTDTDTHTHTKEEEDAAAKEKQRARMLLISFILMIFIGLGNRILGIVMYTPMQRYPLFSNLLTTLAYVPTSLLYVLPMIKWRPDVITPDARAVPQYVWLIMGTFDSIAGVMQSLAQANLNAEGSLVVLLLQSAIPISMLITKIFLKTKYRLYQYIGAVLVIAGILIDLVPSLVKEGGDNAKTIGIWSAVMVLSCVPMTLSSVYKEKALGDTEIDPIYLNLMVAVYQFIISFPLLVPSGLSNGVPPSELGSNLLGGMKCYVGINSVLGTANTTIIGNQTITTYTGGDDCASAPLLVNLYIVFNLAYNVLIIMMLKYGSSNILWLCLTLQVPIANFVFAIPALPNSKPVQLEDGIGLLIIMMGLITYRFFTPVRDFIYKRLGWAPVDAGDAGATAPALGEQAAAGDGLQLASTPQAPGATPILGPRAHRSKVSDKQKAQALQQQRAKLDGQGGTGARGRTGSN